MEENKIGTAVSQPQFQNALDSVPAFSSTEIDLQIRKDSSAAKNVTIEEASGDNTPAQRNAAEVQSIRSKRSTIELLLRRGEWSNKIEFILSCVGFSVGLGNVWRFPYLAYKFGGAAFVFAYLILQFLIGKPMYLMELTVGQYSGKGPTRIWDMNPAFKGVGLSVCIVALITGLYYNVILAYTIYFFFASMQTTLPWTVCLEEWIREYNCVVKRSPECTTDVAAIEQLGECTCSNNASIDEAFTFNCTEKMENVTTAAELYFYKIVIQRSSDLDPENIGTPIPELTLCLLFCWTVIMVCLLKGIKTSSKVVYFTATFPYLILLTLLIRVSLLDGAVDGAKVFLLPEWSKLLNLNVWVAAAGQVFFSLGVTFGGIITFGSYNKFENQVYRDAIFIATLDIISSFIGGLVVFTTFGVVAKNIGARVTDVAKGGYGLAFVVYPEALSYMPPSNLWSVLFFFMLFTLGLDSEFAFMETVLTGLQDEFPKLRPYKSCTCIGLCMTCFVVSLPFVCPGGDYVVTIMDFYGADFSVIILAWLEVVGVMWVYGVFNYLKDIEYMLGKKIPASRYWVFCWAGASPGILGFLFIYRMIRFEPPKYPTGEYFSQLAQSIGWLVCAIALFPVPLWFVYMLICSYKSASINTWKDYKAFLFSPNAKWVPNDGRYSLAELRERSSFQS
ncbi:transporter [Plakobranchus ocellatus]|uniref:Transporter n=1 Tax=Plakobranchus ocellatus TaxID=259542 RepID=A0AAV4DIB8_9GAST|nr:transporter [Plakobranchus ocellatus]